MMSNMLTFRRNERQFTKPIGTNEGPVIGEITKSCTGKVYQSFSGIPYANPPVGSLRFLPPEKADERKDIYVADKKNICCYQGDSWPYFKGSEDCLYLNIYVPDTKHDHNVKLPVMVYIHGGGYSGGDGGTVVYGPDYLIDNDVILVTINYRLGVFGFMTLANDVAPGNLGLRDQQLALKWVKNNIVNFGGDDEKVTIFGQSAGAMSCMYQLVTPSCQGLFNQIIAQSGVFWDYCHLASFSPNNGLCLAERLGYDCDGKSDEEILDYLQNKNSKQLLTAANSFNKDSTFTIQKYVPCVDDYCKDPFLPKDGHTLLKEGNYEKVPIIIGTCRDEGLFMAYTFNHEPNRYKKMNQNWNDIGPLQLFKLPHDTKNDILEKKAIETREFYFGDKPFGFDNYYPHAKMCGDQWFETQCHLACTTLSSVSDLPVYKYRFDHEGKHSLMGYVFLSKFKFYLKAYMKIATGYDIFEKLTPGVNHGDELNCLFRLGCFNADEVETDNSVKNHMTKLWTNFAKFGKPTEDDNEWRKFSASRPHEHYLINTKSGMSDYEKDYIDRIHFWSEDVIPAYRSQSEPNVV